MKKKKQSVEDKLVRIRREIREKWISGKDPISFSGATNVGRYYPGVKQKDIKEALAGIDTYTLYRREKRPKYQNPYFIRQKREQMQADLIDLRHLSRWNGGVKYLLAVIDVFSRFAWVEPLKKKDTSTVLAAFKEIVSKMKFGPAREFQSDQGGEFVNESFQQYLKSKNIAFSIPNNKAPHVERFNQTLQDIIYKYMEQNETRHYVNKLQGLVSLYNNRIHRIIATTPFNAEQEKHYSEVLKALNLYYKNAVGDKRHRPKFQLGDWVRISIYKGAFHKGYYQTFKPKVYVVEQVLTKQPVPMYKIADLETGKTEAGSWYEQELQLVSKHLEGSVFKIEKVLESRGKGKNEEVLVKWKYWPSSENSWIKKSELSELGGK